MALQGWEAQQEKVFVGWVNSVLTRHEDGKGGDVESLGTAFTDGVQLIRLVESLAGESIGVKYKKNAKNKAQMIDNLNQALAFASDSGLQDHNATVAAEDFVDSVHTQISGFVWTLFKASQGDRGAGADSELLEWCASTASKVNPGVVVHDFKSSFQDGTVLASIVAASDPSAHRELLSAMSNGATDKVALVGMATEAAAKDLQVPQLIEAGLIASASADEKSMQMYIALIRMAWDQLAGERPEAARLAELEAIIVALRSQLDTMQTSRTALKFQLAAAQTQLAEANVAKQAEADRATKLQEDLDAAKQQLEDGAQRLANEQSRHAAETAALHDEIARLGAVAQELNAGQETLRVELEEVKAARIAAAKASGDEHAAELSAALENEKLAAERASAQEAAAAAAAAEAAAAKQQTRETVRQAKAAFVDAQIKAESAFKGRKALTEEVNAARRAAKELAQEKADLETSQGTLAEYSKTAFWSGNATLPYGCQKCGWLFKSASEKDKDQRDETAGQVAKKQSKMAKSKIAAIRDSVWKKRWFVLSGGALYYYKDDRDASADPKGFFFLHDAKLQAAAFPESANSWQERLTSKQGLAVPLDGGDDPLALRIQGKSVTLNLKAPSQEERISWGVTIQKHIAYAHYLEGCWAQGRAVPSPHLAQLLLDVTPTDGKSFEHQLAQSTSSGDAVSAVAAVAALGASELNRVVIPAGSALVASASTDLLTELLGGVGGASIQSLKLTRVLMSARGLYQLATQALPALCNLAELDLGYLNLQPEDGANQVPVSHSEPAAQAVAVALSPMAPSLTSLKLDGMPFGTTLAAAALGQALSGLTNLSTLTLADCDLGGVGATACFGARCGATLATPGFQGQPCNGPMRPTPGAEAAECFCDDCEANGKRTMGTSYTCAGGCDFDLCAGCYGTRCCGRRPCALPPSLTSLDVSRCGLLSVDIGRVGSAALKDALRKASKAPAVVLTPISLSKGPLGFGMKIGMDGTVESFAEDEPCAKDGGIVLGAKIVSVNGIDTADKTAIAEALRSAPDGEPVVFGMQTQAAAEAAKLKPPKPKPPRPSEGVPPAATGGAAGDATVAPTEATWGPVSASLLGAPKLRTLQLQGNEALEDSGAAALAALLLAPRALPGIVELGLAQCGLAEAGLRTVATVMGLANGPKSLCVMDLGGNRLAGSLIQGVGFGREGRGALYQFDELKLRR